MRNLSESERDFIKIYFLTLIAVSILELIYGGLYVIFGEQQKYFSDIYKGFIFNIALAYYVVEIALTIIGIFALIKFIRNKLSFLYIVVPCSWFLKFIVPNVWSYIILDVFLLGMCSYILFAIRKNNFL